MTDTTHPLFRPVWVEGNSESRLGYVIELSYPVSVVYVKDCGVIEIKNCKLHFLLGETHAKMRMFAYEMFGLTDHAIAITQLREQV